MYLFVAMFDEGFARKVEIFLEMMKHVFYQTFIYLEHGKTI